MNKRHFRNNHYVPQWYQERFLDAHAKDAKYWYLDLTPETIVANNGKSYVRKNLLHWGAPSCFCETDLYTTKLGSWESTDIERLFFGRIDNAGKRAVEWFDNFDHTHFSADSDAFHDLLTFMSVQKLRTPKGIDFILEQSRDGDRNNALMVMQQLRNLYCAIWSEGVWAMVDADQTDTRFIISDHPVTVYNQACFPGSNWCRYPRDPEVWQVGTHTLFALSPTRLLIITNLSWVRNPYQDGKRDRPNPSPLRPARPFDFRSIQVGRKLNEQEVNTINFIIKKRARRYVAAGKKEWLFPEAKVPTDHWRKLDERYLLMPDPRGVHIGGEYVIGYSSGASEAFDEHGRQPHQPGYNGEGANEKELHRFYAFQGEYARLFGPRRRGLTIAFDRIEDVEDSPECHQFHLEAERRFRPSHIRSRSGRRGR